MKKFTLPILAVIISFTTFSLHADERDVFNFPVSHNDSSLRKAFAEFSQFDVSRGEFTQVKTLSRISRTFESSGTFVFSHVDGIIWKVLHPVQSTLVLTENRIIQISNEGNRTCTDVSGNRTFMNFSSTILSVFSGDIESLSNHFLIYYIPGEEVTIGLIPKDPLMQNIINSLILRGSNHLESLVLEESSGDSIHYSFTMETGGGILNEEEIPLFNY